jgi:hypothetical protein
MKDKREEIKRQNGVETFRELMKKGLEVAMLGNSFADIEEGLKLAAR